MAKPLQQTVSTANVFFSMVVALGLQQLLGPDFKGKFSFDNWLCFAAALLVILRFLFGSANHLWKQFSAESLWTDRRTFDGRIVRDLLWHLLCLIVIGLLIVRMCYSRNVTEFLGLNIVFGGVVSGLSALVTILALVRTPELKLRRVFCETWSATWTVICLVHAIAACWAKCCYGRESSETVIAGFGFSPALAMFVLVLLLLLGADLAFQVWKMAQPKPVGKSPAPDAPSTAETD